MIKPDAVNQEESAASNDTLEIAERHANFLPTDKEYMRTGVMPEPADEKPAAEKKPKAAAANEGVDDKAGAAAGEENSGGDDDAAASKAASSQDGTRSKTNSENRWAKLSRKARELEIENARLKGLAEGAATRETKPQESQPAAAVTPTKPVEPKIDDVDPKTGKAKFATFDEYLAAVRKFDRDAILADVKGDQTKTEQQRQAEAAERTIEQEVTKRVEKIREKHTDYDDAISDVMSKKDAQGREELFYTKGSHIDGFFLDSDVGHEVMYTLAKNWDAHKAIFARDTAGKYTMNPVRQLRELAKIEYRLESGSNETEDGAGAKPAAGEGSSSAKPISQAPRPAHQTSGKGTVQKDAIAQAVLDGDSDTYIREQNAKDLERRKKRA